MSKKKKIVKFNPDNGNVDFFADESSMSKFLDKIMEKEELVEEVDVSLPPIPSGIVKELTGKNEIDEINNNDENSISDSTEALNKKKNDLFKLSRMKFDDIEYNLYVDYLEQFHFTDHISKDIIVPFIPSIESMSTINVDADTLGEMIKHIYLRMIESSVPLIFTRYTEEIENYLNTHYIDKDCKNIILIKGKDILDQTKENLRVYVIPEDLEDEFSFYIDCLMNQVGGLDLYSNEVLLTLYKFLCNIENACGESSYLMMDDVNYIKFLNDQEAFDNFDMFKNTMNMFCKESRRYDDFCVSLSDIIYDSKEIKESIYLDNEEEGEGVSNDNDPFPENDSNDEETESNNNGERHYEDDNEFSEDGRNGLNDDVTEEQIEEQEEVQTEEELHETESSETNEEIEDEDFEDFEIEGSEEVEEEGDMVIPVIRS